MGLHERPKRLAAKLTDAIRAADGLIAVLTKSGAARPAIQQEIGVAVGLGKPVYAMVEDGVDPATLTLLQGLEYIRLDLERVDDALLKLQRSITHQRNKQREEIVLAIILVLAIVGLVYLARKG